MKKVLCMLLAVSMLLMLAACGGSASSAAPADSTAGGDAPAESTTPEAGSEATPATGEEIVIGGIGPLTGDAAQYGIAVNNGIMLGIEEINAAGGVLGSQIKYVNYDDQHDPTAATTAYDRLMNEDGMVALIGAVTTAPTMAVAQKAVQDGIPMITPSGTGAAITEVGDNIFRTCFTDPYQGELMAHYAQEKLGATTVAVLYETGSDYSKGVADAFNETAQALGLEVTTVEAYQTGTTDYNAQLSKIKEGNPDVVMAPCYYGEGAMILNQARALGLEAKFLGPDGWDGLLNQLKEGDSDLTVLNGAYYCTQYALGEPSDKLQAVMDAYEAKYNETEYLNMFAILGYESAYLMAAAMEDAGSTDFDAVCDAMRNLNYDGVSGSINFAGGQDPQREAMIVEFVDGEEKLLGGYSF